MPPGSLLVTFNHRRRHSGPGPGSVQCKECPSSNAVDFSSQLDPKEAAFNPVIGIIETIETAVKSHLNLTHGLDGWVKPVTVARACFKWADGSLGSNLLDMLEGTRRLQVQHASSYNQPCTLSVEFTTPAKAQTQPQKPEKRMRA